MTLAVTQRIAVATLGCLLAGLSGALTAEEPLAGPEGSAVVARIGERTITAAEVDFAASAALDRFPLDELLRQRLRSRWVEVLVERELVLGYLERTGAAASEADVELSLRRFAKQLESQDATLEGHLAALGLSEAQFRRTLLWKLSWRNYIERYATPPNLEKFFEKKRPHFDGGKRRVAHILWKLDDKADQAQRKSAWDAAIQVQRQIAAQEISFEEAARKHSQAPTAPQGGEIGWVERHGSLPESVAQAAFDLSAGSLGGPVESPAGVHLIQCTEAKPGSRTWRDAADELRPAVANYLFRWIADKERPQAAISIP